MIAVLQRVSSATVSVAETEISSIGFGLLALVGADAGDDDEDLDWIAHKLANLRVFADEQKRMNRSLLDVQGELLLVSQFTLVADLSRGRRPSFVNAMTPEQAVPFLDQLAGRIRDLGVVVRTGVFGAVMQVALVNDGPVTLVLDSRQARGKPGASG